MAKKVRIQFFDTETKEPIGDADIVTSADAVIFSDGTTLEQKVTDGSIGSGGGGTSENITIGDTFKTGEGRKMLFKPKQS